MIRTLIVALALASPAFAEKLTPEEMKALVAHVRSFVK